jgi:hypothetical protein
MRLIILITLFLIPLIGHTAFPIKKGELKNIEKINFFSSNGNSFFEVDSSQKFIDWSKIPKFLFLPIPPVPLILIVFMIIHGNSSARAVIITLLILSLLFGLLLMNWVDDFNNSAGIG